MISLFFRNLLFTILQPGLVAGLVPFLILDFGDSYDCYRKKVRRWL